MLSRSLFMKFQYIEWQLLSFLIIIHSLPSSDRMFSFIHDRISIFIRSIVDRKSVQDPSQLMRQLLKTIDFLSSIMDKFKIADLASASAL